jgi:hypothetical protein
MAYNGGMVRPQTQVRNLMINVNDAQPPPTGTGKPVWPIVVADMIERNQIGTKKYGTPLRAYNGRDALMDAYQEALDLVVYLRQSIYERDGK